MRGKSASGTKHARIRETVCKILSLLLPLKTFISNFVAFVFAETLAKREFTSAVLFLFGLRIIRSVGSE